MVEQTYKLGPAVEGEGNYTLGPALRFQPEAIIGATPETIDSGTAGLPAPHGVPQVTIYPNIRPPISAPPGTPPQPQPVPAPNPNRIKAIVGAFGQGWDESTAQEKLGLSNESFSWLQRVGVFRGPKDDGPLRPLRAFNEMLIGGSAMMLDAALRTPGGLYRGTQAVLHEMGVPGDIVSLPDAFAGSPEAGMRPGAAAEKPAPTLIAPEPYVKPSPILPVAGSPFADVPRSLTAKTGIPEVDRVLLSPVTKTVIDNAVVDRSRDVPYMAGGSEKLNDATVYVDRHIPKTFTARSLSDPGKTITFDPAEPAIVHENVEQHTMEILKRGGMNDGEAYRVAHFNFAEVAEGAWYRAHDIDQGNILKPEPGTAEAEWNKHLPKIQHEDPANPPPNLYTKPYPHSSVRAAEHESIEETPPTPAELERAMRIIQNDHTLGPVDKAPMLQQARELGVIGPVRKTLNQMSPEDAGRAAQYGPRNPEQAPRPGEPGGPAEQPSPWRQRLRQAFDKMDTPQAVRDVMEKAIDESGDEFANVRRGILKPTEQAMLAEAFGLDPSEILPKETSDLIKTSAQMRNAIELVRTADTKIKDISIQIAAKQGVDDAAEVAQLIKLNMQRDMIVKQALVPFIALRSEFGRTGNVIQEFMKIQNDPTAVGEFVKTQGRNIKSVDDVRELAKLIANTDPDLVPSVMAAQSRTGFGKVYWMWVNGLISGIITHSKYVAANEAFSLWERGVVTPLAAILNKGRYLGVPKRESVVSAAVRINGKVFAGANHVAALEAASTALGEDVVQDALMAEIGKPRDERIAGGRDGFLTSTGRYVSRKEAGEIQAKGDFLRSEDQGEKRPAQEDKIFMGEALAGVYGQIASVPLAFYNAAQSVKAGVRVPLEDEIELYMAAKARGEKVPTPIAKALDAFEQPKERPIGGAVGRAVGLPGDVAGGIHFFYKLRGREAAMQSLAYKETMNEGYRPTESNFFARMQWHYANPTDAMREQAIADAYRATFMSELGEQGKRWSAFVRSNAFLKWVFPFNHIPLELAKRTYESTPLAILDKDMRADLTGQNGGAAESKAMARIIAGSALMGYFTMLAMNGKATGDYPLDADSRNDWIATGKQPNSIMIGNEWVSFDKFGPAGSLASFGANIAQAIQRGEKLDDMALANATFSAAVAASRIMVDQVGWQSIDNFLKAQRDYAEGQAWFSNTLTSFMPYSSFISQQASEADPYMRQTHGFVDALKYRTPLLRDTLLPKLDVLGEPVPNPQYGNIIRQRPVNTDPILAELDMAKIHIAPPQDRVAGDVKLPPQLYQEYQEKAGALLKAQMTVLLSQPGWERLPLFARQEAYRGAIETVRRMAAAQVIAAHQEIMWQGLNEKLNQINGQPPPPPLRDSLPLQPTGILGIRG